MAMDKPDTNPSSGKYFTDIKDSQGIIIGEIDSVTQFFSPSYPSMGKERLLVNCPACDEIISICNSYCRYCGHQISNIDLQWLNKAIIYFKKGQFQSARWAYELTLECKPNDPAALFGQGNATWQMGEKKEAKRLYDSAYKAFKGKHTSISPAALYCANGIALCDYNKPKDALTVFDRARERGEHGEPLILALAYNGKGVAFLQQENYSAAEKAFDLAIKTNEQALGSDCFVLAWLNKGIACFQQKQYTQSLNCIDNAIKINKDFKLACKYRGNVLKKLGRMDDAKNAFSEAEMCDS